MKNTNDEFCKKIGYEFNSANLLEEALRHRSVKGGSNERLEFLGDSIVNFIIAAYLFEKYPSASEGELSRMRSSLVKGETLAELAKEFELGLYIKLGPGELKSGGFKRTSILADAMEAVIGAIYLDSSMMVCQSHVLDWYTDRLEDVSLEEDLKDPKTRLQEFLQSKKFPLPSYNVTEIEGDAHQQTFHVECSVEGFTNVAKGVGKSRRKAEQEAADNLLPLLQSDMLEKTN